MMRQQAADSIHIITLSPEQGESIRQMLALRGFDEIRCLSAEQAVSSLKRSHPALAIVDTGADKATLESLFKSMPKGIKSLVLADDFDETLFVLCHDRGARDFIRKPVSEAYFISRVIRALQEHRLEQSIRQKDEILVQLGVLSEQSGLFSTSHLLHSLQRLCEEQAEDAGKPLSLLMIRLDPSGTAWSKTQWKSIRQEAAHILRESARGLDIVGEYLVDKFAIILPKTGRRGARTLAARLSDRLEKLAASHRLEGRGAMRISIGIAEYEGCHHYEDLLEHAMAHLNAGESLPVTTARFEV